MPKFREPEHVTRGTSGAAAAISFVTVLLLLVIPAASACSSNDADRTATLASVEWHGGLCFYGECTTTLEIGEDGGYVISRGDGTEVVGTIDQSLTVQLSQAIRAADYEALRLGEFVDTCPTAYDGQEVRYTFHTEDGDEALSTCEHVLALDRAPLRELLAVLDQLKPLDTGSATSTPTVGMPSGGAGLSDGEHFIFVRGFDNGTLVVDPAEAVSGEAATLAAREDGVIGADEALPNDVYIRNESDDQLRLATVPDVAIVLFGFSSEGALRETAVSVEEFAALLEGRASADAYYGFIAGALPATIIVRESAVTSLSQFYLP